MGIRRKQNRHRKSIYLCTCILCSAFLVVLAAHWLPDQARGLKIRLGVEKENSEGKGFDKLQEEAKPDIKDNPDIRVLLMTDGYRDIVHSEVSLSAESGYTLTYGNETEEHGSEAVTIRPDDVRFQQGNIQIQAKEGSVTLESLTRGCGTPEYDGIIELRTTAEGIVIINQLPVESYLCRVVPSEMPSDYELEALKAQAVCARSFAFRQMESYAYPEYEAHVNDSTDFQVYGNSKPQEASTKAVAETGGETVQYGGNIVTTYYYSTSCGNTTSVEAWGTQPSDSNAYLKSVEVAGKDGDYEKELPWYKWKAEAPVQTVEESISCFTGKDIGTLHTVEVTGRGPGDVAIQITATGDKGSVTVETENKIRTALAGDYEIERQDGSKSKCSKLLPSAFITIEKSGNTFVISGGGFGHGIGMSQNGANQMAKQGKNYREILKLFYQGVTIE